MMDEDRPLQTFGKFVRLFAVSEAAIFLGVALICWLGGWRTLNDYATGLFIAGAIVMGIGAASVMGSNRYTGDVTIRYIETVSDEDGKTRQRRYQRENESSRVIALKTAIIGMLPLVVGIGLTLLPLLRR